MSKYYFEKKSDRDERTEWTEWTERTEDAERTDNGANELLSLRLFHSLSLSSNPVPHPASKLTLRACTLIFDASFYKLLDLGEKSVREEMQRRMVFPLVATIS